MGISVTFLVTEQEGAYFTTWRSWILYLSIVKVTISMTKKNHVQFPLCTAVKSRHISKGTTVQPGNKAARETHFIQVELVSDQRFFYCSHFYAVTEILSIILNTLVHTLINSIYTFIILCSLICTLLLHAPNCTVLLQLATDFQFY